MPRINFSESCFKTYVEPFPGGFGVCLRTDLEDLDFLVETLSASTLSFSFKISPFTTTSSIPTLPLVRNTAVALEASDCGCEASRFLRRLLVAMASSCSSVDAFRLFRSDRLPSSVSPSRIRVSKTE